ncbi:MAG TPA: hypothetical protein VL995_12900 [Cellvibrio sp.]|nr:hypothetical protein [Cellvibrio sp.]
MNKPKYQLVIILLFAWSVLWVPTFLLFWVKQFVRGLPDFLDGVFLVKYFVPAMSISGELAIFAACLIKFVNFIKRNYGPFWLNALLVSALAINYWHWVLIGEVVSS